MITGELGKPALRLCLAVFLLACCALRGEDWPRFRGPNGSGVGTGSGLPVEFGPDKNLAWKIPVKLGHSSPVVVGRQIYLTAADANTLLTLAYDVETGRELWSRPLPRERSARLNKLNTAATPTAAADTAGVVVFFQDFGLAAYSSNGKLVWTLPTKPMVNLHGMGCSPILADSLVVQVLGSDTGSSVLAVNRQSGEKVWEQPLQAITHSTPVMVRGADGESLLVVMSTGEVVALRGVDGKRVWWLNKVPYQPTGSPVASPEGNIVYLAAPAVGEETKATYGDFDKLLKMWDVNGDGKITQAEIKERGGPAGAFPQIDLNGDGVYDREEHNRAWTTGEFPHLMAAIPAAGQGDMTGKMIWVQRKYVPKVPSPLVYQGVFYAIRDGGVAVSLDAEQGTVWKEGRIAAGFGAMYASPVAGDGKIYATNQAGKAAVLRAGREWEVLAINDLGEEIYATPALSGNRIFMRSRSHLWCFQNTPPKK